MGSVPNGPVIVFRFDSSAVAPAIDQAMQEVRAKTKQTSEQVADDWRRMAAQIRASVATGALSEKDVVNLRQQSVSTLSREVDLLRNRETLTTKELANLKAMTLELERQKSFRAGTGGITTGTANALNQVSFQSIQGIERIVDSLVNRYLGGAAGAVSRTLRDISYYSSQASSGVGGAEGAAGGAGLFSGIRGAISGITEAIGPATVAVGGFVSALVAAGAIGTGITLSLSKQSEQFKNLAAVTGLSSEQVQVFSELAKESELDVNGIVSAIARFQSELGEYVRKGSSANEETNRFVAGTKALGVSVTDASGKLRDPIAILSDLSGALRAIPDSADRSARALDILGVRGRELAPLLLSSKGALSDLVAEITRSGPIIDEGLSKQLDTFKGRWDSFTRTISSDALRLREDIASLFLNATGLGSSFGAPPQKSQYQLAKEQAAKFPFDPKQSIFLGSKEDNDKLIEQAKAVTAGGQAALQIEEKRKEYNDAIKNDNGVLALSLAQQIKALEDAAAIEASRLEIWKRINAEVDRISSSVRPTKKPASADQVLDKLLNPTNAPNIGQLSTGTVDLSGIIGIKGSQTADQLLKQINDEHDELFTSQYDKDKEYYQQALDSLNFYLNQKLISQDQYNDASTKLAQDWAKTQQDLNKKFISDADSLFNDLLSGNSKNFAKSLQKDIENIVTEPARKIFDNLLGSLLGGLNQTINGTGSSTNAPGIPSSGAGGLGTIFGGATSVGSVIFNTLGGRLGLGGVRAGGAGTSTSTGQFGVATAAMYVTANDVYVAGNLFGTGGVGGPSLSGGVSSFFGNNNPFGGGSVFFGNNSPFANAGFGGLNIPGIGGQGTGAGGLAGGNLSQLLGGLLLGGLGASRGSVTGEATGAATVASALGRILSGNRTVTLNGVPVPLASVLSSGFGGAGMLASGIATGGVSGGLEDVAGGAEIGSIFGPLGTGIGAGIGGLVGILRGIFGANSWQNRVATAMRNQAIYLPPSENFSFASNGSISSTLGTGFSQSGSSLSTYSLGSTPFYANAIYGPLTNAQQAELNQIELGLNSNQPFLGFPGTNPFTGQQVPGYKNYPSSPLPYIGNGPLGTSVSSPKPTVNVNLSLPGYIDGQSAQQALGPHLEWIARNVAPHVSNSSTGLARNIRAAVNLP